MSPVENKLFNSTRRSYSVRGDIYPNPSPCLEQFEGGSVVVFCDEYDTHGSAIVSCEGEYYVGAWLCKDENDKTGQEQDISKPIYFHGNQVLKIASSGDIVEIHLRHKVMGDLLKGKTPQTKQTLK